MPKERASGPRRGEVKLLTGRSSCGTCSARLTRRPGRASRGPAPPTIIDYGTASLQQLTPVRARHLRTQQALERGPSAWACGEWPHRVAHWGCPLGLPTGAAHWGCSVLTRSPQPAQSSKSSKGRRRSARRAGSLTIRNAAPKWTPPIKDVRGERLATLWMMVHATISAGEPGTADGHQRRVSARPSTVDVAPTTGRRCEETEVALPPATR